MKKLFILVLVLIIAIPGFSQQRIFVSKDLRNKAFKMPESYTLESMPYSEINPTVKAYAFPPEEEQIGDTRYDDQANASIQNRIYLYDDGTIGATWTRAMIDGTWTDRGTGYNYFDGSAWGSYPTTQVEVERTGWPSYSPLGENGEIIAAHGANGLVISTRDNKGTGSWNYTPFPGPEGHEYILWNRTITSGTDHMRVHTLAVTASTVYSGTPYLGLNGALVYSLSTDGGNTWTMENEVLEGMSADNYVGFDGDTYCFAPPKDDIVAFVVGESWYDLFLMKSTDGGETFEKTLIWEHPYPFFDPQAQTATDTFYCPDGSHSCIIDNNGTVHVAFGIDRAYSDGTSSYWFPFVDGIAYWNENMPGFSSDMNALSPYGDPGSELIEDYNLIAWSQDLNNNGTLDILEEIGTYYLGLSSFPQFVYGQNNQLYLVYSSVTETYDNGTANYRHLWARTSTDGGLSWGDFFDLTSDLVHIFDECVYPSCAANSDDYIHLVYQTDLEPGVNIWGTTHPPVDNKTVYMKILKADITGIDENKPFIYDYDVSQNFPNPFKKTTEIKVNLRKTTDIELEVFNLTGQKVFETQITSANIGMNTIMIDAQVLHPGVYFYTVTAGYSSVTRKMIVE
jgi:hypothetical protein